MPRSRGQLTLGAFVLALGAFMLVTIADVPASAGYSGIGPGAVPRLVGVVLVGLGALLLLEAWRSGFKGLDEAAERALGFDTGGFLRVSAGILLFGLLIERTGFIVASALLFVAVARGFGSRRWLRDAIIGLVLAGAVFALFDLGLGLTLPRGVFGGEG